jgi:hypothetical protein
MLIYSENGYEVEIVDNTLANSFSVWFESKPEDLVFHLLRAVGFRDRSFGREFYHENNNEIRWFAEELQNTLKSKCLPVEIPYKSSHKHTVASITNFKFSIATLTYIDSKGKSCEREFVVFETSRLKRKSFAWLIGFLEHGDDLNHVNTTEKVKRKKALQLFNESLYKVKLPTPFGSGISIKRTEPPNVELQHNFIENNHSKNGANQHAFNGMNNGANLSVEDGKEVSSISVENADKVSASELFRHYANNELKDGLNDVIEDKMREIINPLTNNLVYLNHRLPIDQINKRNNRPKQAALISEPYTEIFMCLYELVPNMIQEIHDGHDYDESEINYYLIGNVTINFHFQRINRDGKYEVLLGKQINTGKYLETKKQDCTYSILIDPIHQTAESEFLDNDRGLYDVYYKTEKQVFTDLYEKNIQNLGLLRFLRDVIRRGHLIDLPYALNPEKE